MARSKPTVSVIGRGVVGLTCATVLHEYGYPVEVVAPIGAPRPISRLAGGMLAPFCEGESAPDVIVQRGIESIDWWAAHLPNLKRCGTLVIAPPRDQNELLRFCHQTRGHQWVTPATLEPHLNARFAKGLFFPTEAHLDPNRALETLEDQLRRAGVRFSETATSACHVDARGHGAAPSLPGLRGVRGEMMHVRNPEFSLSRPIRLLHPRFPCYIVPRADHVFMIGATMLETAFDGRPTVQSTMELLSAAFTVHPSFAHAEILEIEAGVRPAFADNVPKCIARDGRFYVNGMYRHGFLMAPQCAKDLLQSLGEMST